MTRKNLMVLISGGALSLGGAAFATTPDLDIDRAYAAELKADAAKQTSLLQSGGSGHDGWFHIGDGNNRLNVGGLIRILYVANFRDDDDLGASAESFAHGFTPENVQLRFWGNVYSPQLTYRITFDYGTSNGEEGDDENNQFAAGANLRDAWGQYNFEGEGSGLFLRWGQFQAPIIEEENIADEYGLAVGRSVANEFFNQDWSHGAILGYATDGFKIQGYVGDGVRAPDGSFTSGASRPYSGDDADFAVSVRGDLKLSGDWQQFDDITSFRGEDRAMKLGGAFLYESGGSTGVGASGTPTQDADYLLWTLDFRWELGGANVYAAYMGNDIDDSDSGNEGTNHGFVVQGGVFLAERFELFGRWDALLLDENLVSGSEENYHYATVGFNYYPIANSHTAKLTVDAIWAVDESLSANSNFSTGDTQLLGGSDDEFAIRAGIQLLF
jgi:hypothetical protein